MNLLNLYFTPFATLLVLLAIYFPPFTAIETKERYVAFGVLVASLLVNQWFSRNTYRWIGWTARLRQIQIWITFLWSVILFYILFPYFAPAWLLVALPVAAVGLNEGKWQTLGAGALGTLSIVGIYYLRWDPQMTSPALWAQAWVHAGFIPVLGLFVHALAQTALKMRDMGRR